MTRILFIAFFCTLLTAAEAQGGKPKNIIFMIGDGMGLGQITGGMYANGNKLNLERMPVIGLVKTQSYDNLITDSASGATAYSCGVKTYNGAIGVDKDTQSVETILEELHKNGYATGMVVTCGITHATPASFIAHQKSRNMHEEIAADFLQTPIDCWIGGDMKYFARRDSDDRNLVSELEQSGYLVKSYFDTELSDLNVTKAKRFVYFTADKDPLPAANGRDYLLPATSLTLQFLDAKASGQDHGFFLMIEGSQIDWGGHANNTDYIITEMLDFDRAIGRVLDFAEQDGETLLIITADHETGGFAIQEGSTMDKLVGGFTTVDHTASMVPLFAYGPGAATFAGIYENTAVYHKLRQLLGL